MAGHAGRRQAIIELVQRQGFAPIELLARQFRMTPQTIRRDINALSDQGLLQRFHGGAGLPSSTENLAYQKRQVLHAPAKQLIARLVAEHVADHASLFINIGTTNEAIARSLLPRRGLSVVTNNLNVASILGGSGDVRVIVAGGQVRPHDRGIVGEASIDLIRQFKVDIGIIGISGIDADGTLLDFDYREVRAAQAIIENSRRVFLAADHSKFGRSAMVRLGSFEDIDELFTDAAPPPPFADALALAGVKVHIARTSAGAEAAV